MRNRYYALLLIGLCFLGTLTSCGKSSLLPKWLGKERTVAYRTLPPFPPASRPASISVFQALEDLEHFKYLIETAYAGYEYQQKFNHVNFNRNFRRAKRAIRTIGKEQLTPADLPDIARICLAGVQDGHINIENAFSPLAHENWFYAEITLTKKEGKFLVESSSVSGVAPGDVYRGSKKQLFKIYSDTGERYRIGTLSRQLETKLRLKFGSKKIDVPLVQEERTPEMISKTVDRVTEGVITYLRIPSFLADTEQGVVTEEGKARLEAVWRNIHTLGNYSFVIIDLRNNGGGYLDTAAMIPAAVFHRIPANFMYPTAMLISPATTQASCIGLLDIGDGASNHSDWRKGLAIAAEGQRKRPRRFFNWEWMGKKAVKPIEEGPKLVFIINEHSASASELVCLTKSLPGVTVIGTNSAGILSFVNILPYALPHSGIKMILPATVTLDLEGFAGEGIGVLPDYWVLDEELADVLRQMAGSDTIRFPWEGVR